MREYNTAKTIFGILEFIAWVAVVGGLLLAFAGASTTTGFSRSPLGPLGAIPGLIFSLIGILTAGAAQFFRAGVDTAEMTGQILKISRDQLALAKTANQKTFADHSPTPANAKEPDLAWTKAAFTPPQAEVKSAPPATDQISYGKMPETPTHRYAVEHGGETIQLIKGKAHWQDQAFETIDEAKRLIDQMPVRVANEAGARSVPNPSHLLTATRDIPKGLG